VALGLLGLACASPVCRAQAVVATDFAQGDFAALGWKADQGWDIYKYAKQNVGPAARCKAKDGDGNLSKTFPEVKNPKKLTLSFDAGWGWGRADQGGDSVGCMLLDAQGNGYVFSTHRANATWAVQWGKVTKRTGPKMLNWAPQAIDGTHKSIVDGGGLNHLTITREASGKWTIQGKDWNQGAGATVTFTDNTTTSFTELLLIGAKNFDEMVYNKVALVADR
jgi:hypothetical protein